MAQFKFPDWATDTENNGIDSTPNKVEPTTLKKSKGWGFPEKPPRGEFNYWMNLVGDWIRDLAAPKYISQVDAYVSTNGDRILPDNSAAILTIDLPATPTEGDTVYFRQVRGQPYSTFSLTVGRSGETIMGLAEDMIVTTDEIEFEMYYTGTEWEVNKVKDLGL